MTAAKRYAQLLVDAESSTRKAIYLWVVLGITRMEGNRLQVQATIEIDGGNDVSCIHI